MALEVAQVDVATQRHTQRTGQPVHTVPGHSMTAKNTIRAGDTFNDTIAGMPSLADTAAVLQEAAC